VVVVVGGSIVMGGGWWLCKNFSGKNCSIIGPKFSGLTRDLDYQGLNNQGTVPPE